MRKIERRAYENVLRLIASATWEVQKMLIDNVNTKSIKRVCDLCLIADRISTTIKRLLDEPYYICSKATKKSSRCRCCEAGEPYPKNKKYYVLADPPQCRTVGELMQVNLAACAAKAVRVKEGEKRNYPFTTLNKNRRI